MGVISMLMIREGNKCQAQGTGAAKGFDSSFCDKPTADRIGKISIK